MSRIEYSQRVMLYNICSFPNVHSSSSASKRLAPANRAAGLPALFFVFCALLNAQGFRLPYRRNGC
ncbi:hypothetical protein OUZ56_004680 [Daphnia magna]|uniref:Uncharacterized protein n=1 Tax=Daphnia magna TaxID=35525 RepID=A0ABQ9YQI9_9CRUS|nr:hypothetical protein OUZ56_004680 [Daphnia magna]